MSLRQILTIAEKELKLEMRFKWNYFGRAFLDPLKFLVLFGLIYSAFYVSGAGDIGGISRENYIPFLLIGSLVYSFFSAAWRSTIPKFITEKYWQTIQATLIAPVNKLYLLIGMGLAELMRLALILAVFLIFLLLLAPIGLLKLLFILFIILLIFFGTMGISFIIGTFALSNENFLFLSDYALWGLTFLSCFYYPVEVIPEFLRGLVYINPVYHGVSLVRDLWMGFGNNFLISFLVVLGFAVITPLISVWFFNRTIKKFGVRGY